MMHSRPEKVEILDETDLDLELEDLEFDEETDVEKVSYQEILQDALAAEDAGHLITIPKDSLAAVQKGIMNAKSAARKRAHSKGIPWEAVTLRFKVEEDETDPDWVDLRVFATRRATVLVRRRPVSRVKMAELSKVDLSEE